MLKLSITERKTSRAYLQGKNNMRKTKNRQHRSRRHVTTTCLNVTTNHKISRRRGGVSKSSGVLVRRFVLECNTTTPFEELYT